MSKVLTMSGKPSAKEGGIPNQGVIDTLEKLLEDAKRGDVQQVAVSWTTATGIPLDAVVPSRDANEIIALVGSLELLKHTIVMQLAGVGLNG